VGQSHGDCQAQAEAAAGPITPLLLLREWFKQLIREVLVESHSGVSDGDNRMRFLLCERKLYCSVRWSELDGIRYEIIENLPKSNVVGFDEARRALELRNHA